MKTTQVTCLDPQKNRMSFSCLSPGEVFWTMEAGICIKTNCGSGVNLACGSHTSMSLDKMVVRVKAEVQYEPFGVYETQRPTTES